MDTDEKQEKSIRVHPCESVVPEYLRLSKVPAPTDSDKRRPLLARYVNQYTARFKRIEDPEVPPDQKTKLVLDGKMKQTDHCSLPIDHCSC